MAPSSGENKSSTEGEQIKEVLSFKRKLEWMSVSVEACFWSVLTYLGVREIPVKWRPLFVAMAIIYVYRILAKAGLFSVWDLLGWTANLKLDTVVHPVRFSVLRPDRGSQSVRKEKIGVVLAGGGGKGAYQVGCWKAMMKKGMTVNAVSGTSVGALNAALLLANPYWIVEWFWENLSASRMVKLQIAALPLLLLHFDRWRQRYAGQLTVGRVLAIFAALVLTCALGLLLWLLVPLGVVVGGEKKFVTTALVIMGAAILVVNLVHALWLLYSALAPESSLAVSGGFFSTAALEKWLERLIHPGTFAQSQTSCYAAVSHQVSIIDWQDPKHFCRKRVRWFGRARTQIRIKPRIAFRALHMNLNELERDPESGIAWVRRILRVSASLPFVFSSYQVNGNWLYDGGLADNVPMTPLLGEGCTRIFVIHLDHSGVALVDGDAVDLTQSENTLRYVQRVEHVRRLWDVYCRLLARAVREQDHEYLRSFALSSPGVWPDDLELSAEIIHVFPSRPLGSFVTGTLNFTGKKARWLMNLGEKDMDRVLEATTATRT